jgi:hypothetical protein
VDPIRIAGVEGKIGGGADDPGESPILAAHDKLDGRRSIAIVSQHVHLPCHGGVTRHRAVGTRFLEDKIIKIVQIDGLDPKRKTETVGLQGGIRGEQARGGAGRVLPV